MKLLLIVFVTMPVLILNFFCCSKVCWAFNLENEEIIQDHMQVLEIKDLNIFLKEIDQEVSRYLPSLDLNTVLSKLQQGKIAFDIQEIIHGLLTFFGHELMANMSLLGNLVILAVICAVLNNLQVAFEKGNIGKLAHAVAYLVLLAVAVSSFTLAINAGQQAVENMVNFIYALLPILLTLMAGVGGIAAAALLHPMVLMSVGILSTLIKNVLFPLIYFTAILSIVSHISPNFKVTRLAQLLREITLGLLGLFSTIFIGVLSIYGVAGAVADGVTIRTAKYLSGAFVPVIGRMVADSLEAVIGTSLLIKNAVGIVGVMAIIFMALFPILKILSLFLVYRLAAAVIQPFGETQMSECLHALGNVLLLVFASVTAVGIMFFLAISIMVGLGNITVMMR